MDMSVGHHAATRQSWSEQTDMKELITRLRDEYPSAALDEIVRRFRERVRDNEEYLIACTEYAVVNTWNNMERLLRQSINRPAPHVAQAAAQVRETKIQEVVDRLWLNRAMPNGKLLRYCTREDIAPWGQGFSRIHKKLKPGQIVGDALSEDQVKAIMK